MRVRAGSFPPAPHSLAHGTAWSRWAAGASFPGAGGVSSVFSPCWRCYQRRHPMWLPALSAVSDPACPAPSVLACPIAGPRLGSPACRGFAGAQRPPRWGGARHLGLSGGSCKMSVNILCGLLQQASRCRCWRASRNRNPAVTNGSGTAAAVPTRAPGPGSGTHGFADALGPRGGIWVGSDARGCGDGLTLGTRCCCQLPVTTAVCPRGTINFQGGHLEHMPGLGRVNSTVSLSRAFCFFPIFLPSPPPLPLFYNEGFAQL